MPARLAAASIGPIGPLALILMLTMNATPASAQGLEVPQGYRLVWSDEFDREGLPDPAKWVHDTHRNAEGWYNNELQYYAGPRRENAEVVGGQLIIRARREALSGAPDWGRQRYTSTRLITRGKAEWTYGFFEVRARMPCGRGTWPAIWTLGSGGRWPEDGELDILEHMGHTPGRVSSAVHVAAGHAGQAVGASTPLPTACSAFHRYQMHWTADGVTFGVDGQAYLRYPRTDLGPRQWPFDKPQFLLLNLAIGGDLGGPVDDAIFPAEFRVDYVRYQRP